MKNIKSYLSRYAFLSAVLFFFIIITSASCSREDAPAIPNSDYSGTWKVSLYFDNTNETSKFTGYSFQFNNAGTLTASNGTNTVNGTWSLTSSKLIIDFGITPVFNDLNDDWLIVEKTNSSIKLKDDNTAQDDQLQFIKL